MARRRVPPEPTMDDSVLYLTSVKETFHDEPAKFKEFLKLLVDIKAHRINKESGIAKMTQLIKRHPKLLRGLRVFLPEAKLTIPAKANKGLGQSQTIVCIRVSPELITLHMPAYKASVKEAFKNEPVKYKEWTNIFEDFQAHRVDKAGAIARLERLMKTHRKLLLGLSVFYSPGTKITLPPEAEQHITSGGAKMTIPPKAKQHITLTGSKMTIPPEAKQHIASHNNKRKRVRCDDPDYDPVLDKLKSPSKKKRKIKGKNVSLPKKKGKLSKRTIHCKKCGQAGHNSRSCGKRALQVSHFSS